MKSKYESNVLPRFPEIEAWLRNGVIEKDIAHNLGISEDTFYEYKKKYPEFSELLRKTKSYVNDVIVAGAYLKRAIGYTTVEKRREYAFKKNPETGETERTLVREVEAERHIPGDARALEYWLKMRSPELWRDAMAELDDDRGIIVVPAIGEEVTADDRLETST